MRLGGGRVCRGGFRRGGKLGCQKLGRIKLLHGGDQVGKLSELDYATIDYYASRGASSIRIEEIDLEVFKGIPAELIQRKALGDRESRIRYSQKGDHVSHTIICCPTPS